MKNLGDSTEGKRGPASKSFSGQEPRGTPGEAPLVFSKAVATERRRAWEEFFEEFAWL